LNPHQKILYDELQPVNAQKIGIFKTSRNENSISSLGLVFSVSSIYPLTSSTSVEGIGSISILSSSA